MANQQKTNRYMTTARLVGFLILTATITYMVGDGLITSILNAPDYLSQIYANNTQVLSGALIKFVAATANVSIGLVIYPVLKKHSETVAIGYVATRIFDSAGVALGGIGALLLLVLSRQTMLAGAQSAPYSASLANLLVAGNDITFVVTMIALGLGSIPFCALLYRARLVPRPLAALGLVGYVALVAGSVLELSGVDPQMMHFIPGGLFELLLPLWLIVKGFNSQPLSAAKDHTERELALSQA